MGSRSYRGDIYQEVMGRLEDLPVINTHSHHLADHEFRGFNLDALLRNSYVNWMKIQFDNTKESRSNYLAKVRFSSRFLWLEKAIKQIYGWNEPLTPENWDVISGLIAEAHLDQEYHLRLLSQVCGYRRVILDAYWNPGSDNGFPAIFTPTFRIDMFLRGYSKEVKDRDGNNPLVIYGQQPMSLDDYATFMKEVIAREKRRNCAALKCTLAYDRGIDIVQVEKYRAEKALGAGGHLVTEQDVRAYQDYVLFQLCRIAAELDLPMQFHTGLGALERTNAIWLLELVKKNPDTTFVLFHGGYPWLDDITGLAATFPNVHVDLCWLPLLSPTAAQRLLHELIEIAPADHLCWGCDTWTAEESYGALLAARHVLARVLSDRIADNLLSWSDAERIACNILYDNARKLYKFTDLPTFP